MQVCVQRDYLCQFSCDRSVARAREQRCSFIEKIAVDYRNIHKANIVRTDLRRSRKVVPGKNRIIANDRCVA